MGYLFKRLKMDLQAELVSLSLNMLAFLTETFPTVQFQRNASPGLNWGSIKAGWCPMTPRASGLCSKTFFVGYATRCWQNPLPEPSQRTPPHHNPLRPQVEHGSRGTPRSSSPQPGRASPLPRGAQGICVRGARASRRIQAVTAVPG